MGSSLVMNQIAHDTTLFLIKNMHKGILSNDTNVRETSNIEYNIKLE